MPPAALTRDPVDRAATSGTSWLYVDAGQLNSDGEAPTGQAGFIVKGLQWQ